MSVATADVAEGRAACTHARYEVRRKDLPVSCPQAGMALWDAHPRVYLPLEKRGEAQCPYCGAVYVLKD